MTTEEPSRAGGCLGPETAGSKTYGETHGELPLDRGDLEAAAEIAAGTLGTRMELYAMYPANRRGSAWCFRVKVSGPDAPGARRYFRRYSLRLTKPPERSHNPSSHALGALCVAIFERRPYAQVETLHPAYFGGVRFRDVREFLRKYEGTVNQERGECTCESDEIEAGTIDGSGVIFSAHVPPRQGNGEFPRTRLLGTWVNRVRKKQLSLKSRG